MQSRDHRPRREGRRYGRRKNDVNALSPANEIADGRAQLLSGTRHPGAGRGSGIRGPRSAEDDGSHFRLVRFGEGEVEKVVASRLLVRRTDASQRRTPSVRRKPEVGSGSPLDQGFEPRPVLLELRIADEKYGWPAAAGNGEPFERVGAPEIRAERIRPITGDANGLLQLPAVKARRQSVARCKRSDDQNGSECGDDQPQPARADWRRSNRFLDEAIRQRGETETRCEKRERHPKRRRLTSHDAQETEQRPVPEVQRVADQPDVNRGARGKQTAIDPRPAGQVSSSVPTVGA